MPMPFRCARTKVPQSSHCLLVLCCQESGFILHTIKAARQEFRLTAKLHSIPFPPEREINMLRRHQTLGPRVVLPDI